MLNVGENIVVVAGAMIASIFFEVWLNRIWRWEDRRPCNELIGWQLSVLGTTYAVILGFMLYTVWTALGEADLNADLEASAVVDLHHMSAGLPEPQRTKLQTLARSYADTVIRRDWPQMARGEELEETSAIDREMWDTVMSVRPASAIEITAQQNALVQLASLDQHRLTRMLQSHKSLPKVLWCVLLVGGTLTVISACTFGMENRKLQMLQVVSFSLLVSLTLVAIADIHRPFHGLIHVRHDAFLRAQQSMQNR